jgi:hypothetical protein
MNTIQRTAFAESTHIKRFSHQSRSKNWAIENSPRGALVPGATYSTDSEYNATGRAVERARGYPSLTGRTHQRSIGETRMNLVEVFKFEHVDEHNNAIVRAPRMATLDAIQRLKGVAIESTMKMVDKSELDGNGFYPKRQK